MIREANADELPRLRVIQSTALDEPWPGLLEVGIDGPPLVLVLDDGDPVGYALVVRDFPVAYLAELAIAPAAQRQGYGTLLLSTLVDRLRTDGYETIRLTARADDEHVRSFYATMGFSLVEEIPDHYEDGDGVLLARELDTE